MMTLEERLAVVTAAFEGAELEMRKLGQGTWRWKSESNLFNFDHFEYRVREEPLDCYALRDPIGGHVNELSYSNDLSMLREQADSNSRYTQIVRITTEL